VSRTRVGRAGSETKSKRLIYINEQVCSDGNRVNVIRIGKAKVENLQKRRDVESVLMMGTGGDLD
jgi:hypothetical protein